MQTCRALRERRRGQVPLLPVVRRAAAAEARRVLRAASGGSTGDVHKALRVSRYFGDDVTAPQVRFSIWSVDAAEAAVSL